LKTNSEVMIALMIFFLLQG